jgi:AAA15 family ATPase/GTPase
LPVSAIYGPNGGGKSNVLEALQTLGTMVLRPVHATKQNRTADYKFNRYPVKPFAFSEEGKNNPTEFEIFFRTENAEYRYILHTREDVVVYESLDRVKMETGRKSALFQRKGEEISLRGVLARLKISEGLSKNLPLLSYLGITYMNNEVIRDAINWFESDIDFLNYGNPLEELRTAIASSDEIKKLVLNMITEMDLDIENFRVEEHENNQIEIFTQHNVDGYKAELTLSEESSGTKKLFGLLPFIAKSLVNGTTLSFSTDFLC